MSEGAQAVQRDDQEQKLLSQSVCLNLATPLMVVTFDKLLTLSPLHLSYQ